MAYSTVRKSSLRVVGSSISTVTVGQGGDPELELDEDDPEDEPLDEEEGPLLDDDPEDDPLEDEDGPLLELLDDEPLDEELLLGADEEPLYEGPELLEDGHQLLELDSDITTTSRRESVKRSKQRCQHLI